MPTHGNWTRPLEGRPVRADHPAGGAIALRAILPQTPALTAPERSLLRGDSIASPTQPGDPRRSGSRARCHPAAPGVSRESGY